MSKSQPRREERSALHTHYKCFPTRGGEARRRQAQRPPAAEGGGGKRADKGGWREGGGVRTGIFIESVGAVTY